MIDEFLKGVVLSRKLGVTNSTFAVLQQLLYFYPSGIIFDKYRDIAKHIQAGNHANVFYHIKKLEKAGIVQIEGRHRTQVIKINVEKLLND
jgi:DNA-binding MarR family transcriptional regulator